MREQRVLCREDDHSRLELCKRVENLDKSEARSDFSSAREPMQLVLIIYGQAPAHAMKFMTINMFYQRQNLKLAGTRHTFRHVPVDAFYIQMF